MGSRSANTAYGKRSNPGLVTIGGGGNANSRQSRAKWGHFGASGSSRAMDEQYGITDIEMGPRTTVTAAAAAGRTNTESSHSGTSGGETGSAAGGQGTFSRESDEFPIMGISKTTQVQWTVENVKGRD